MDFRGGRRRFLALGTAGLATLPGCTGMIDGGNETTTSTTNRTTAEETPPVEECGPETSVDTSLPRPADWPQLRADARNTGANLEATGPPLDLVESTDDLVEIHRLDGGAHVYPPSIADGTAYFTSDGTTYAADANDGTVRWELERTPRGTVPAMVAGRIIEASERPEPRVSAHDPTTGCELWRFQSEDEEAATGVLAATDDAVYVNFGPRLYAISPNDGTELWRIETGPGEYPTGIGATDEAVYVSAEETVYALDATDGTELWQVDIGTWYDTPPQIPVIGANTVYVQMCCDRFDLVALSTDDGSERWRFEEFAGLAPVVDSGRLFITYRDAVRAFSADGKLLWTTELELDAGGGPSRQASLAGNALYVPLKYGIAMLDSETGDVLSTAVWREETVHSDPAVIDGAVYLQTQDAGERQAEHIRAITAPE